MAEEKEDLDLEVYQIEDQNKAELLALAWQGVFFMNDTVFDIDFSDSRGGAIYVSGEMKVPIDKQDVSKGYNKINKSLVTKNTAIPTLKDDGVTFDVQTKYRMGAYSTAIYSRDTLSLVQRKVEADALQQFFEANPKAKNAVVLSNIKQTVIAEAPKDVRGLLNGKDLKDNPSTSKSETQHEKDNLKVYETPSVTYAPMLKAIDKSAFKKFIEKEGIRKIKSSIYAKSSFLLEVQDYFGGANYLDSKVLSGLDYCVNRIYQAHGDEVIDSRFGEDLTPSDAKEFSGFREIAMSNDGVANMINLIDRLYKEGVSGNGFMSSLAKDENKNEWKEVFGFTPPASPILIFDPQAGSGEDLLKALDETKFNAKIKGLELRDNIKYADERISVIGGVNTSIYAPVVSDLFHTKQVGEATDKLLSYLNPPYTSDDSVARETVDMYKNGMMITGLFPTKMRNFLSNNLSKNSLIAEIPRELTGYDDPNTPERFLFVLGEKHSFDSHVKIHGENSTSLLNNFNTETPHVLSLPKDATPEMLQKALEVHIQKNAWGMQTRFLDMYKYYAQSNTRETILSSRLHEAIRRQGEMLENSEILNRGLMENKNAIIDTFMPIEVARKQKVFIDPRFYSSEGIYERFGFEDVSQNVPLLVYYRDNMPSIFGLITQIADEKDIALPIDRTPSEPFVLGEKPTGEKDIVTNMNLGMMKLKYYPSNIDLSDQKSKDLLFEVMMRVYKGDMSEEGEAKLREALMLTSKIVIKSEKVIRTNPESSQTMPKEAYFMLDNYGYDIGRLNMEIDEFFRVLEEMDLFRLEDYIELAQLQSDKKRSVIEGFIREMKSPIYAIAQYNNIDMDEMDRIILEKGSELFMQISKKEITMQSLEEEILKFSETYNLKGLFTDKFKVDNDLLVGKLKSAISTSLTRLKKKTTDSLAEQIVDLFNDNPLRFYEDEKETTFEMLEESLKSIYVQTDITKSEEENLNQLEVDMLQFKEDVVEELTPFYRIHSNINVSYSRMAETLIYRYAILKQAYSEKMTDQGVDKLYKNIIGNMLSSTLGLLPHQVREAEGFLAVSDEKDMEHLYAEMRSGKTRTFIATLFLLGLHKDEDITIILETANIPDITEQMLESFPFMAMNARYFGDPDKIATSMDSSFENLIHDNMYPVPYRIFTQSKVRGGGETIQELNKTFGQDMLDAREVLRGIYGEGEVTREKLLKDYPNSKFKKLLTFTCK